MKSRNYSTLNHWRTRWCGAMLIVAMCCGAYPPGVMAQAIIGTDAATSNGSGSDPVDDFFNFMHWQAVYTAAELSAAGISAGSTINALGFSVSEDNGPAFPTYTVHLAHTTATNSAAHDASALTNVFGPASVDWTVQSAGSHQMITFTTPFVWNGTSNLLVDICTGSSSMAFSSPYGGVRGATLTNGSRRIRADGGGSLCSTSTATANSFRPQIRFNYAASGTCSGTPAPGNTTSSAGSPCSGVNFTLGLQNPTTGTDVTYQWQSSADGNPPWNDITGATSSTRVQNHTAATYYRCNVTCPSASPATTASNPLLVGLTTGACLCAPYTINAAGSTADEDISNVTVGTMNNSSTCGEVAGGAGSAAFTYANYCGVVAGPAELPAATVSFSLTQTSCGGAFGNGFQMYVDWNQDGDFLDANEQVYNQPVSASGNHTKTGTFTVPVSAPVGITRMRVVNVETTFPTATNYSSTGYTWGETEDYCFTVLAPPPCSGTPAPGNTESTASTVCPSVNFTLSLQAGTPGEGVTYEWQSSPDGNDPWTDFGTDAPTQTLSHAAPTYYRCKVNCDTETGISNPVFVDFVSGTCECAAYPNVFASSTADEEISNVTVGAMNNTSACGDLAGGLGSVPFRYSNYAGVLAGPSHAQGESGVAFSLTQTSCGGAFGNGFQLYIDWNQDGDFLDANEQVYNQPVSASGNHTKTGTFDVPVTAPTGTTRMRVVNVETTFPTATNYSNTGYTWGETEDYCFTVVAAPPCAGTPAGGTTASNRAVCTSGETVTMTVTGLSAGTGLSRQWEQAAAPGGPWSDVTGGSGATTNAYTSAPITGTIYYRLRSTCTNEAPPNDVAYSNVVTVNIVPCDYDVTYMPASWTSIQGTGNTFTFPGSPFNGDDVRSNTVSLTGTTFLYQGQAVDGFQVTTNGWMTFNTANTSAAFSNGLTGTGQNRVLAPFWDDLVTTGNSVGSLTTSLHYEVIGTLGSGSAVIVIQWSGMERFQIPGPNMNFQVRLYEGSNNIEYVYGDFEGFNGTYDQNNLAWTPSYSIGYNGATPAGLTQRDRFAMQSAVTNHWSASGDPANHAIMPDCFSKFLLTPGTYTGPVTPPAIPVPANDELATAQVLTPNEGPCVALCGTYYTSRGATASAEGTTCAGLPDDDVWFVFNGNGVDSYTITLRSSPGYNGDFEYSSMGFPGVCISATGAGLIETQTLLGALGPVYIRVFENGVGSGASGQFSICVNTVAAPPVNDDICGAIGLTTAGTCINTQGNMLNATASPEAVCTGTPNRDMWYSFSPLTTSDQIRVQSLGTVNAVLQVFSSSDFSCTGTLTSLTCTNATSTGGLETYSGPWNLGETYFIRVYHFAGGSASGLFNICITGQVPGCLTTSIPANAGTVCTTGGPTTLSWTAVAGAAVYDVYLDAGAGPATTLVSFEQAGTTYNTAPLANGGYSWRVVPKNAVGEAVGCTDRTFTVATAPASSITAGGPTSFCSPGSVLLTADNLAGTRVWSPGGATTPSITATATGNYTVAVTVGACTTVSDPVAVTAQSAPVLSASATPPSICVGGATQLNVVGSYNYCASTHTSGCGTDAIVLVELEDLSQASACSAGAYFDYTGVSASLLAGVIYTVDITMGSDANQYAAAWIDYNADGDFDDVDEFLGASGNAGANGTASITFETPLGAANGSIRMRVIGGNDSAILGTQSCGASSSSFGETEDYTVIMSGGADINITYEWQNPGAGLLDDPLSATPVASGVAPLPYTFTVTATSGLGCETNGTVEVTLDLTDTDGDGVIDCEDSCPEVVGVEGGPCVLSPSPYLSGHLESCICVPNACTQPVVIELRADPGHANEAGWEVLDPNNFIVCKGGYLDVAYGPNAIPQTDFCCLESGSYRLRVYDSAGDGFVSGGVTGGYQLRHAVSQARIIDNFGNFKNLAGGPPDISALSTSLDAGRFELPLGTDKVIYSSCDKLDWVNYQFIVASENPLVSAQFTLSPANSGYEFWFFDPNGTYSYRRFRSHTSSDGTGTGATRACHFKINRYVPLPPGNQATNQEIPYNTLLNVRVRGRANGSNFTFGPACQFKIDPALAACPLVKLQDNPASPDNSCGVSKYFGGVTGPGNRITATPPQFSPAAPAGQVRFQFRFRIPGEIPAPGSCIVRPPQTSATLPLNWTTGDKLKCNTTYEVDVRVSKDGGLTWCVDAPSPACSGGGYTAWGKLCNVNITTSTFCPVEIQGGGSNSLALQGGGELTMYPNPNRGDQVFISLSEVGAEVTTVSVDIFDLSGKKVTTRAIAVQDGNVNTFLKLNGDLAAGMYMVNITAGEKTYTERLVIQP